MKRVMIVGAPGSGKSTLARELGSRTGLPVHHMDLIHHLPDWVERPKAEKIAMARAVERQEAWIFEGGLSATYETRLARADTVIWLDLPVALRLWRVTKRAVRYLGRNRPDLPEGCVERLDAEMLEFYRFIWRTRKTSREAFLAAMVTSQSHFDFVHLRSPRQVRGWLRGLGG